MKRCLSWVILSIFIAVTSASLADCNDPSSGPRSRDSLLPIETLLPMANPGANSNQQTFLRFTNPNDAATQVEVYGIDDGGFRSGDGAISFTLGANASKQITAQDVENGNAAKNLSNLSNQLM